MKYNISRAVLIAGFAFAIVAIMAAQSGQQMSLDELHNKIKNEDSFIVQIELENCPACNQLAKREAQGDWFIQSDPLVITIENSQKEIARKQLKHLIPSFLYYPSIYYFENGQVKSEFDLSTLDQIEQRYLEWQSSNR